MTFKNPQHKRFFFEMLETTKKNDSYGRSFFYFVGWIKIDGTSIDYPVMQATDNPGFYLTHDFEKRESKTGLPYLAENCSMEASDNLIIHGKSMGTDEAFGTLGLYRDKEFYEEYGIISFSSLTERSAYEIAAVFEVQSYAESDFIYDRYSDFPNEDMFTSFMEKCKRASLYETNSMPKYGDKLITLSAIDHTNENHRLVIVGRLVE